MISIESYPAATIQQSRTMQEIAAYHWNDRITIKQSDSIASTPKCPTNRRRSTKERYMSILREIFWNDHWRIDPNNSEQIALLGYKIFIENIDT